MSLVTEQNGQNVKPMIEVGTEFKAVRPDWMNDRDWREAHDALADLWFNLSHRAAAMPAAED